MLRWLLILGCCFLISKGIAAQSLEAQEWIESILANQDEDGDLDLNTILEQINEYLDRPADLNDITREQLSALFFLSDLEINAILKHREDHGDFVSVLELQSVEGLSIDKVRLLSSLVKVGAQSDREFNQGLLRDQKSELYLKWRRVLETQRGYTDEPLNPYLGDPNKLYVRYKYTAGRKVQLGLTAEKDAGEEFFRGSNQQGFDYYSGHLQIKNPINTVDQIIIGDYSVSMGQGLVAAMGFGTGKSTQVMRVKNRTRTLRPYTSVNEFNYLRGAAFDIRLNDHLSLTSFASYQKRDANFFVDTINNNPFTFYTSLPSDGFHRTINEIRKEDQLGYTDIGGSLRYRKNVFNLNANFLYSGFNGSLNTRTQLYQLFSSLQRSYVNGSLDYSYIWKNFNLFGEFASDKEGDLAILNGLILGLDKSFELSIVYRNIARDYQTIYANSFTESSTARNEKGVYLSSIIRLNKSLQVHGYADFFTFPWLRFRVDSPSNGREYFIKFWYHKKRKADFYIQYFFEQKDQNQSNENFKTTRVASTNRHRLRFHNTYVVNASIEIRNRLELSRFTKTNNISTGFLLYQDLIFRSNDFPLSAIFRYAVFDTDDYDSRIYAYENDLLYEFSIPAFSNRGFRTYANLRYRVNRFLTAEFRIARTYFNDRETVGSGLEEIGDNKRTDVKAQLRFKF
ncbi:ComEA family DNA-binding protein [Portibacter marinus]|uniref:ComEA family DNA-binding protein n=1 Tax=Portibacter marinus TaxID=2898660 RepID=UPI001F439B99|nr:helix-hairpin-helix domain-containing protein [Portibacter marinus]